MALATSYARLVATYLSGGGNGVSLVLLLSEVLAYYLYSPLNEVASFVSSLKHFFLRVSVILVISFTSFITAIEECLLNLYPLSQHLSQETVGMVSYIVVPGSDVSLTLRAYEG
jgi:hypothetical protein